MQLSNLRRLFIILMYFCFFGTTILKAQDGGITVTPLSEILGGFASEQGMRTAVISPDGTTIAWYEREDQESICLYSLESSQADCYSDESAVGWASTSGLRWDPGSRYIAFHLNFSEFFRESDIWVFDTINREFTNLTDDGIDRIRPGEYPPGVTIDIVPTWDPQSTDVLYFFRYMRTEEGLVLGLYRLNITTRELELTADLASVLTPGLTLYDARFDDQQVLSGRAAISPDGTQLAFIALHPDNEDPKNGIWLVDLRGQQVPQQIAAIPVTEDVLPTWPEDTRFYPNGLGWLSNHMLIISVFDGQFNLGVYGNIYVLNIEAGSITPLIDFSSYSIEQVNQPDETGIAPRSRFSLFSVLSASDHRLLGISPRNRNEGRARIIEFMEFQESSLGTILYEFPDDAGSLTMETGSISDDGRVAIISGYLIELSN